MMGAELMNETAEKLDIKTRIAPTSDISDWTEMVGLILAEMTRRGFAGDWSQEERLLDVDQRLRRLEGDDA